MLLCIFIVFAVFAIRGRLLLGFALMLLNLMALGLGSYFAYDFFDQKLRKREIVINNFFPLSHANAAYLDFSITVKRPIKLCKIKIELIKKPSNALEAKLSTPVAKKELQVAISNKEDFQLDIATKERLVVPKISAICF